VEAELFTRSEGRGKHGWEFYTGDEFFPERTHQKRDDLSSECTPGCSNLRTTAGVVQADLTETDAPGTSEVAAPGGVHSEERNSPLLRISHPLFETILEGFDPRFWILPQRRRRSQRLKGNRRLPNKITCFACKFYKSMTIRAAAVRMIMFMFFK